MSQRFEAALQFVLKWEGSRFTNDPDDRGGATRFGVTQRVYDAFRQGRGQPLQSVKFITMDEVRAIYTRGYWAPVHGDRMPAPLDLVLFDTGVLMGVGRAVRFLQQALGVPADGAVGPVTLNALQGASPAAVARTVMELREARLRRIVENDPSQGKFLRGWLNRLNDLRRTVGAPAPEAAFDELAAAGAGGLETGDAGLDADVGPDPDPAAGAAGRAERDLPDDEDEGPAAAGGGAVLQLLAPAEPAAVLAGGRALLDAARGAVFVLDLRASSDEVLRAVDPSAGPGAAPFGIPVQAVETVTPLGVHGADAGRLLAAVTFRPGFESLADTFHRLGGAAAPAFAGAPGEDDEAVPAAFGAEGDDDPAAPGPAEISETADLATARTLSNVGTGAGTAELEAQADAPLAEAAATPTLDVDIGKVRAFLAACTGSSPRVTYGLGAKVPFFNAVPGRDFKKVDCSGFVREAIRRATAPRAPFPDGSVVQHEWVRGRGFRKSSVEAAFKKDGAVRIAFLRPQDAPSGVGHVVLVHNAVTYESHGGTGPNSRAWTGTGWQKKAFVYRLKDPVA